MRLLIALPDPKTAWAVRDEMESALWEVTIAQDGGEVLCRLEEDCYDVLLMHQCLPVWDGAALGRYLSEAGLPSAPRVLYVRPPETCQRRPEWADAAVANGCTTAKLCRLLVFLAKKPLSNLAAAQTPMIHQAVENFLDLITLSTRYKGRAYAGWLLEKLIASPALEQAPVSELYAACAAHFGVTPASLERCLRIAVESVFTQGSMQGIELFFGATVDPERGKPTNRAFLLQAAQQLRYSLTDARSPKSMEMHHSPAAPTNV